MHIEHIIIDTAGGYGKKFIITQPLRYYFVYEVRENDTWTPIGGAHKELAAALDLALSGTVSGWDEVVVNAKIPADNMRGKTRKMEFRSPARPEAILAGITGGDPYNNAATKVWWPENIERQIHDAGKEAITGSGRRVGFHAAVGEPTFTEYDKAYALKMGVIL